MAFVTGMPSAVEHSDTPLELSNLAVKVAWRQVLSQQFHTMRLGLCAASAAITDPSSPDGPVDLL
jgi:hypothetical protein